MKLISSFIFVVWHFGATSSMFWEDSLRNQDDYDLKCPKVTPMKGYDLGGIGGDWFVIQYYASSMELPEYSCMRSHFNIDFEHVSMNFNFTYADDPYNEKISGNLSWIVPNLDVPSHWTHMEEKYREIYNTYVIDTDYVSWALVLHCAEKGKSPVYLSALLLSRTQELPGNVISYLREKLRKYEDVALSFMFDVDQKQNC